MGGSMVNKGSPLLQSDMAIADTGASGHYFLPEAPLTNINAHAPRTTIRTATGQPLYSTGTATLNLPTIPPATQHGHIVPGLTHNLISIGTLCDAGCTALFTANALTVTDAAGTTILSGARDTNAPRLWKLSLRPHQDVIALHVARPRATLAPTQHKETHVDKLAPTHTAKPPTCPRVHTHLRTHDLPTTRALVAFLHATAGYPLNPHGYKPSKAASTTHGLDSPTRCPTTCPSAQCCGTQRAIRTFKDHFLAILAGTAPSFPADRWDLLIPHAELTLNLLRASHCNPTLSAWEDLFGPFNFAATPLGPTGCRILIHSKATTRRSWDYRSHEGFYVGPALHHYRCYRVLNKELRSVAITDAIKFRHHYLPTPDLTAEDKIIAALQQLQLATKSLTAQLHAIYKLRDIFRHYATTATNPDTTPPRVQALPPRVPPEAPIRDTTLHLRYS
eukprot:CCRYP_017574-RA/>CCRYP_017574-RA protein AED:0.36 eAED:0.36 QI:0/0/0/1/1/1/3/0/447